MDKKISRKTFLYYLVAGLGVLFFGKIFSIFSKTSQISRHRSVATADRPGSYGNDVYGGKKKQA